MLLMIRIWACLKCSPQVGLSCTMKVQQLYQQSSCKETQHYYFAIGTYLLNTNCVLYLELEMIKREETEMIMHLIPQGGKMYK